MRWSGLILVAALAAPVAPATAQDLVQGVFDARTETIRAGHGAPASVPVADAPADTDWTRWAMLHDGETYRLYAFRTGTQTRLYAFAFNPATQRYEWGHGSEPELRLVGMPRTASTSRFAMLHDGRTMRLYLQDRNDWTVMHQFGLNRGTGHMEYGHRAMPTLRVTGFPTDTDWRRWAMLHDGRDHRFIALRKGGGAQIYQGVYDDVPAEFRHGWRAAAAVNLDGIPPNADRSSFSMLHDGQAARLFFLSR